MFDRFFSAALAFCVLAGGTLAVGAAMLEHRSSAVQVVELPRVNVIGHRPHAEAQIAQAGQAQEVQ